jgi:CubicO group peptidase (beta-lactamase class C family)
VISPDPRSARDARHPVLGRLRALLSASVERHGVPGASIAVAVDGQIHEAAAGWANRAAGLEATPETVFHFGSVTKTLTATLVARLVDRGQVELDAPIARYVPEFSPPDPATASGLTVRHCLSHTAGLVSTIFVDTGRNDDAVARQVELISREAQFHAPGALLSYCNSGILLLGRLLERALGKPWHAAIVQDLAQPLGLSGVVTQPEQALRTRYAVGHVFDPRVGGWSPDPQPFWMPGHAPAGSTCAGRARDLVAFACMHLEGGRAADGAAYLSERIVSAMQTRVVESPVSMLSAGWGLGWSLYDWNGTRVIGHDGSTAGSNAYLRIDPQRRVAVALLVNCRAGLPVYEELCSVLFQELAGAWEGGAPRAAPAGDLDALAGSYTDRVLRIDLEPAGDGLQMSIEPATVTPLTRPLRQCLMLHPCGPGQFYVDGPDVLLGVPDPPLTRLVRPYAIFEAAGAQWLHQGAAAFKRI